MTSERLSRLRDEWQAAVREADRRWQIFAQAIDEDVERELTADEEASR